jgi:hypothetical protein
MSHCPGCGQSFLSELKFCSNCGKNLKSGRTTGTIKKVGMVLTMLGGSFFFLPALLAILGFVWGTIEGSVSQVSGSLVVRGFEGLANDPASTIVTLVALFIASVQIIVAGAFVSSDRPSYRRQGGGIALAAAAVAYAGTLVFPFISAYFATSSAVLQITFVSAIFVFFVQFVGLVLTIIGASLGITYRGLLEGIPV